MSNIQIAIRNNASDLCVSLENTSYVCPTCKKEIECNIHWALPVEICEFHMNCQQWNAESVEPLEACECTESLAFFDPGDTAPMPNEIKEAVRKFLDELEK